MYLSMWLDGPDTRRLQLVFENYRVYLLFFFGNLFFEFLLDFSNFSLEIRLE